jgi:hypothetical protein
MQHVEKSSERVELDKKGKGHRKKIEGRNRELKI